MKGHWSVRHWVAQGGRGQRAAELVAASNCEPLSAALMRLTAEAGELAFLVVRIDRLDIGAVHRAVDDFYAAGGTLRLCLAGDRASLEIADASAFDSDRVGLVLDEVDTETPLAHLIWNRIEACRFDPTFVARATHDLRLSCALESMLTLARDLGVCTFGASGEPGSASLANRAEFDYLPCAAEAPVRQRRPAVRANQLPEYGRAVAQPMRLRKAAGSGTDFSSR